MLFGWRSLTIEQTQESDQTLRAVSSMSIIPYIGRMIPRSGIGIFIEESRLALKKKHPIGIPAFPIAAMVEIIIQLKIVKNEISTP